MWSKDSDESSNAIYFDGGVAMALLLDDSLGKMKLSCAQCFLAVCSSALFFSLIFLLNMATGNGFGTL